MRRPAAPSLSYANVMSTVAAFIALGGVSWAAVKLPAHSVGTTQLKTSAVTTTKIKDGTIKKQDLSAGVVVSGPAGAAGAAGPQGPQGQKGDKGDKGDVGDPVSRAGLIEGGPRTVRTYHMAGDTKKTIDIAPSAGVNGQLELDCDGTGGNEALNFAWINKSATTSHEVTIQYARGSGANVVNAASRVFPAGGSTGVGFGPSSTVNLGAFYALHVLGDDGTVVDVHINGASLVKGFDQCFAAVTTQIDTTTPINVP